MKKRICGFSVVFYVQSPHKANFNFIRNSSHLMQTRDKILIYSDNRKKHKNALCRQTVGYINVKAGVKYSNYCTLYYKKET
jgi:hypothetical protein